MKTNQLVCIAGILCFWALGMQAQVVQKGTVLIDGYLGFPNLYKTVLQNNYGEGGNNLKVGGIGPLGGRIEYLIADKIGVGLDLNYSSASLTYTELNSVNGTLYDYKIGRSIFRAMPRFNFHFGNSDSFDGYAGVGSGYRSVNWTFESNDPFYNDESIGGLIPVAFRIFVGGRYFFTDLLGIHMEFGLGGGALMQGGLSLKL
jgi:opacity protein-like surface antigen